MATEQRSSTDEKVLPRSLVQRATMAWDEVRDATAERAHQQREADRRSAEQTLSSRFDVQPSEILWLDGVEGIAFGLVFRGFPKHDSFGSCPPTRTIVVEWLRADGKEWLNARTLADLGRLLDTGSLKPERCHGGKDGDCWWDRCPQEADGRANYLSWCGLATKDDNE